VDQTLPSLELLRRMTDRHVLDQLLEHDLLSRAEIAARTGLSKPTVSESVRRLTDSGLLLEVGRQSGRRGRAGTNLQLDADAGCALSVHAGPDGVLAERHDLRGRLRARSRQEVTAPVVAGRLATLLRSAVREVLADARAPVLATAVSAADPVDQLTGRLVELPDSPFLTGELAPAEVLSDLLPEPPTVDNDVNWAAVAEHRQGVATDLSEFAYCYLGAGIGMGLVSGGRVLHGHRGLAGEIAHMPTRGPGGRALRLVHCFAEWGLLRPGTAAIDVPALTDLLAGGHPGPLRDEVVEAVGLALSGVTALLNPQVLVLGGPWGGCGELPARLTAVLAAAPVPVEVRPAALGADAPLIGARIAALDQARAQLPALVSR
jgi:predicted NBD/HSP70 family sugar kinase/biotin operon repressor